MKNLGKWIVLLFVLLVLYLGWRWWTGGADRGDVRRGDDPELIADRLWLDSLPEASTDYVHAFVALSDAPIGAFQKASNYRVELELFEYQRKGNKVRLLFPQTRSKRAFSYRIRACDELPPFDLCLDLSKNPWGGPKRYYGSTEGDAAEARRYVEAGRVTGSSRQLTNR